MVGGSSAAAEGGDNLADYDSPAVNALITQADSTQNKSERLALYGQLLKAVGTDVPYVMLYTHSSDLVLSPKFSWPGFGEYFYTSPWGLSIRRS